MRTFINHHNISSIIAARRVHDADEMATVLQHAGLPKKDAQGNVIGTWYYYSVESTLDDLTLDNLFSFPETVDEINYLTEFATYKTQLKTEYQSTIDTLLQIENEATPTNAQVIAAVKFLAKTDRLLLRLMAKQY